LMAMSWGEVVARLRANPSYVSEFEKAFGQPIRREDVLEALATYERSLVTPNAPFDRYLRGDRQAISQEAVDGYRLFKMFG
ncbi:cytochrome c peroxidase, partial [Rhizobium ruizarguesonis]